MSKDKARVAFVIWSASAGTWTLGYLVSGGWWNVAGLVLSVCGVAWTIRELVRGKR